MSERTLHKKSAPEGRASNIELLRMLAGMAVVILHFNYRQDGNGALTHATGMTRGALMLLEILCVCAVNVFLLISGYFGCTVRKIKVKKLLLLVLQTIVFRFLAQVILFASSRQWSLKTLAASLLPVNYYVVLYVVLMLLAPFLNKLTDELTDAGRRLLILLLFSVFSVFATLVDALKEFSGAPLAGLSPVGIDGSMSGYSIVHFTVMFMLGGAIRKSGLEKRLKTWHLLLLLALLAALIGANHRFLPGIAWSYSNPLIILEACVVFLLFARMRFSSPLINRLAPAAFTCFLIHESLLHFIHPAAMVTGRHPAVALGLLLCTVAGIYLVSFGVMLLWNGAARLLLKGPLGSLPDVSVESPGRGNGGRP